MSFITNDQYQNLDRRVNELYQIIEKNNNTIYNNFNDIHQELAKLRSLIENLPKKDNITVNQLEYIDEPEEPVAKEVIEKAMNTKIESDYSLDNYDLSELETSWD